MYYWDIIYDKKTKYPRKNVRIKVVVVCMFIVFFDVDKIFRKKLFLHLPIQFAMCYY